MTLFDQRTQTAGALQAVKGTRVGCWRIFLYLVLLVSSSCKSWSQPLSWDTQSFSAPEARAYSAAVASAGSLYMGGGYSHAYQQCLGDFWVLDLTARTWTTVDTAGDVSSPTRQQLQLPTGPLMGHSMTVFHGSPACQTHGCLLVIGGTRMCSNLGSTPSNSDSWNLNIWLLDLGSQTLQWQVLNTQLPGPLAFHTATVVSGLISSPAQANNATDAVLIMGGIDNKYETQKNVLSLAWDVAASKFVFASWPDMPAAVFGHSAIAMNGSVWMLGGLTQWPVTGQHLEAINIDQDVAPILLSTAQRFDVASTKWSSPTSMPTPAAFAAVWAAQNTIYMYGGLRSNAGPLSALSVFNTATGSWLSEPDAAYVAANAFGVTDDGYHASRLAPPTLVGAATAMLTSSTASQPSLMAVSSPGMAPATEQPVGALVFGGWQLPAAVRQQDLAPFACVDEELTWQWGSAAVSPGNDRGWTLVAHGAPSKRIEPHVTNIYVGQTRKILMYGGRVNGSLQSSGSAFTVQPGQTLGGDQGMVVGFDLQDAATSYWFNDWWLLDPNPSGPLPIKLRVVDPLVLNNTVILNGMRVELSSVLADGGRAVSARGDPIITWEQHMVLYIRNLVLLSEVYEENGVLNAHLMQGQIVLDVTLGLSQAAISLSNLPNSIASNSTAKCLPRLGATLTSLGSSNGSGDGYFDFLALHGGVQLTVIQPAVATAQSRVPQDGIVVADVTSDTCVYDLRSDYWIGPAASVRPGGELPIPRYRHVCHAWSESQTSYDMVCYGGLGVNNELLGDVQYFTMPASMAQPGDMQPIKIQHTGWWHTLPDGDHTPGPRYSATAFHQAYKGNIPTADNLSNDIMQRVFVLIGGRTGPSADTSVSRQGEVWMLWIHCLGPSTDPQQQVNMAVWTQVHSVLPSDLITANGLTVAGAALSNTNISILSLPSPSQPWNSIQATNATTTPAAGVWSATLDLTSCVTTIQLECKSVINSYRWVSRDSSNLSNCWAAAKRLPRVSVMIDGPSPIAPSDLVVINDMSALYSSTLMSDIRDEHGVSIITESLSMPSSVSDTITPRYSYALPQMMMPADKPDLAVTLRMMTYGWTVASTQLWLNDTQDIVQVSLPFPPVSKVTLAVDLPDDHDSDNKNNKTANPDPGDPGDSFMFDVLPVTPDGRQLTRGCIYGASLWSEVATSICYETLVNRTGVSQLLFMVPEVVWKNTSGSVRSQGFEGGFGPVQHRALSQTAQAFNNSASPLVGDPVVYIVRATTVIQEGSEPAYVGTQTISAQTLLIGAEDPGSFTTQPVGIIMGQPPPGPPVQKNNAVFAIIFRSTNPKFPVELPSPDLQKKWLLNIYTFTGGSEDFNRVPLCHYTASYNAPARALCTGDEALAAGTYWAEVSDAQDTDAVLTRQQVTVSVGVSTTITVQLSPLLMSAEFDGMASVSGSPNDGSPSGPVDDILFTVVDIPNQIVWDQAVSSDGQASFSLLPPDGPTPDDFGYTVMVQLPGLPPSMQPGNVSVPSTRDPAAVTAFNVPAPGFLMCPSDGQIFISDPSGLFPSQPLDQVLRRPAAACSWTFLNDAGDLEVAINFSMIGPGDILLLTDSLSRGSPRRFSLSNAPSGLLFFKSPNANVTVTLIPDKSNTSWGYGVAIAWHTGSSSQSFLPAQLIMLVVSTVSAGAALLAFILLWHFCYRPIARARVAQANAGAAGVGANVAIVYRQHVSKRLLRLLPVTTYRGATDEGGSVKKSVVPEGKQAVAVLDLKTATDSTATLTNNTATTVMCSNTETATQPVTDTPLQQSASSLPAPADTAQTQDSISHQASGSFKNRKPPCSGQKLALPDEDQQGKTLGDELGHNASPSGLSEGQCSHASHKRTGSACSSSTCSVSMQCVAKAQLISPGGSSRRPVNPELDDDAEAVDAADHASHTGPDCCSICLADYVAGDQLRTLPCQHAFHAHCIDQWLRRDVCCPLCKRDVVELAASSDDPQISAVAASLLRRRLARAMNRQQRQQQQGQQQQQAGAIELVTQGEQHALPLRNELEAQDHNVDLFTLNHPPAVQNDAHSVTITINPISIQGDLDQGSTSFSPVSLHMPHLPSQDLVGMTSSVSLTAQSPTNHNHNSSSLHDIEHQWQTIANGPVGLQQTVPSNTGYGSTVHPIDPSIGQPHAVGGAHGQAGMLRPGGISDESLLVTTSSEQTSNGTVPSNEGGGPGGSSTAAAGSVPELSVIVGSQSNPAGQPPRQISRFSMQAWLSRFQRFVPGSTEVSDRQLPSDRNSSAA